MTITLERRYGNRVPSKYEGTTLEERRKIWLTLGGTNSSFEGVRDAILFLYPSAEIVRARS